MPDDALKSLADLVEEHGIDPTEWEFQRLCDDIRTVDEMRSYLDKDQIPPQFAYGDRPDKKEIQSLVIELDKAVRDEARTWREYRISKRRAVDIDAEVKAPNVVTQDKSDANL